MAARRPLCRIGGRNVELPAGDTVSGPNALFTGVATLPALTLLLAASTTTFTVVPAGMSAAGVTVIGSPASSVAVTCSGESLPSVAFSSSVAGAATRAYQDSP